MFQDFSATSDPAVSAARTRTLMGRLADLKIDAFIVPRSDEHMGEYVPASAERLRWLTGFSGSAGFAALTRTKAALFVDGRYTLQAADQVDTRIFDIRQVPEARLSEWLVSVLGKAAIVGFDPRLHTTQWVRALETGLSKAGMKLKPVSKNPVDMLWGKDQPKPPRGPVTVQPMEWAGVSAEKKIESIQKVLKGEGRDATILTLPDSIAWLFNIRGSDVSHNPTPLAFAIVHAAGKPELFVDGAKLDAEVRRYLSSLVRLREPRNWRRPYRP
jgi:Xaa-Pro aminopeptidase